ncbi:uncharacterized protein LOC131608958 isoform X1 [Vicia villosa]|uniref:uncharacterized protein LOC131608958 isoform X1 n=1 Tax=Vicia villosa TaxID=3911 RepID=UPI00273B9533|nr:uncharacterized protein LOC131608958 isoform X1 [Vicia villosa]
MSTAFSFSSSTQALILNSTSTSPSTSVSLRRIITIYAPNSVNKVVGIGTRTGRRKWNMAVSKSVTTTTRFDDSVVDSASTVVRNFYEGINRHDVDSVQYLISENCVYEDLVFPSPFVGRKEIIEFFKKFTDSTSLDLQFVIDDLSMEDSSSVGVTWHLEWKGKTFPFSKGCSFYRLEVINGKRQITYGRDSVEPAIKPGEATLTVIKSVTWLLQRFPQLADRF